MNITQYTQKLDIKFIFSVSLDLTYFMIYGINFLPSKIIITVKCKAFSSRNGKERIRQYFIIIFINDKTFPNL